MVSIIIPVVKNDKYINECVNSIRNSTYKDYEIIIVDEGLERSKQRNLGIARSSGKYLLILDSDHTISPQLIEECVFLHESFGGTASYIPERIVCKGFIGKARDYERSFYNGTRIDAARFVLKEFCPMFDEDLTGAEDWDWDRKISGAKHLTFNPLYHNETEFNLKKYLSKKGYYAQWMGKYKERWGDCPELSPVYRYFGVFVEHGKWRKVVRHPILFACVLWLKFLIGIKYLTAEKVK